MLAQQQEKDLQTNDDVHYSLQILNFENVILMQSDEKFETSDLYYCAKMSLVQCQCKCHATILNFVNLLHENKRTTQDIKNYHPSVHLLSNTKT
jgi:hypothetical protein